MPDKYEAFPLILEKLRTLDHLVITLYRQFLKCTPPITQQANVPAHQALIPSVTLQQLDFAPVQRGCYVAGGISIQ